MSWLYLDDRILEHPKFIRAVNRAGSDAVHLWLGIRAYCGQNLSDGFLPVDMVEEIRGPRDRRRRSAALVVLIQERLIDEAAGGYQMHDYLDWSESKDEVTRRRNSWKNKKQRQRGADPAPSDVPPGVPNGVPGGHSRGVPSGVPSGVPDSRARARGIGIGDGDLGEGSESARGQPVAVDLCRLFGGVRAREVGGVEWQAVPGEGAAKRAAEMRGLLSDHPDQLPDVEPTMTLLFQNAHRGEYQKAGEILKSANFAFAVWCSEFHSLREQLRGIAPSRRSARRTVEATDKKLAELRSFEGKGATPEELAELRAQRVRSA